MYTHSLLTNGERKKQPQLDESDVNAFKLYIKHFLLFFFLCLYAFDEKIYIGKKKQFFIPLKYINM